jgi:hypothetical protein
MNATTVAVDLAKNVFELVAPGAVTSTVNAGDGPAIHVAGMPGLATAVLAALKATAGASPTLDVALWETDAMRHERTSAIEKLQRPGCLGPGSALIIVCTSAKYSLACTNIRRIESSEIWADLIGVYAIARPEPYAAIVTHGVEGSSLAKFTRRRKLANRAPRFEPARGVSAAENAARRRRSRVVPALTLAPGEHPNPKHGDCYDPREIAPKRARRLVGDAGVTRAAAALFAVRQEGRRGSRSGEAEAAPNSEEPTLTRPPPFPGALGITLPEGGVSVLYSSGEGRMHPRSE